MTLYQMTQQPTSTFTRGKNENLHPLKGLFEGIPFFSFLFFFLRVFLIIHQMENDDVSFSIHVVQVRLLSTWHKLESSGQNLSRENASIMVHSEVCKVFSG